MLIVKYSKMLIVKYLITGGILGSSSWVNFRRFNLLFAVVFFFLFGIFSQGLAGCYEERNLSRETANGLETIQTDVFLG